MIYAMYGKTGVQVSAVGFGGMRFDVGRSNEENAELLLYARDKGITYFDTAPSYCTDQSEDIFGIAFKQMADQRDRLYVTSKCMPTENDTYDSVRAGVEKSLRRIQVDYLDFYHVWCIRRFDQYEMAMRPGGQYESLLRLREEGLIRHVVISTHLSGPDVKRIVNNDEFAGILLGVNILNFQYRWHGVLAAHEAGWGTVAMNPLAGGLIPKNETIFSFLTETDETPTEAALRFSISCPQINVTLVGFTTKEHIDMACRVADKACLFTPADQERIKRYLTKNMDVLCTGCGYCADVCPKKIIVPSYMQFYNERLLSNKTDKEMIEHTRFHHDWVLLSDRTAEAYECVACGRCEQACTQHLPIIKRLEEIGRWEKKLIEEKTK
ncbi:MAG: aldo/keto reductase [Sedimentisphaerales bacterium]|nr:aldo/keto reductase [Sedimentisphaerales bacterium]